MLAKFRFWFLRTIRPILKSLGSIAGKYPGSLEMRHMNEALRHLKPGAVILTLKRGQLSNLLIPGHWSHAAIVISDNWVIEAVGKGVVKTRMKDFLLSKDEFLILHPTFATDAEMLLAVLQAQRLVGMPYDWEFEPNDQQWYCFELCWHAYNQAVPGNPFQRKQVFEILTVQSMDFLDKRVWDRKYQAKA